MSIDHTEQAGELHFLGGEDPDEVEQEWVKAWMPRILGITPLAVLALGLMSQGGVARGLGMVLTLLVLCGLLLLFYNFISYASDRGRKRKPRKGPLSPINDQIYVGIHSWQSLIKKKSGLLHDLLHPFFRALTRSAYPNKAINLHYRITPGQKVRFNPEKDLQSYYNHSPDSPEITLQAINKMPTTGAISVFGGKVIFGRDGTYFELNEDYKGEVRFPYRVGFQSVRSEEQLEFDTAEIVINKTPETQSPEQKGQLQNEKYEKKESVVKAFQSLQDGLYRGFENSLMGPSKYIATYLLTIRVPLAIAAAMVLLFQQTQVQDVLLAMVLDKGGQTNRHFVMATMMGTTLSMLLWHTSRLLTRLFPQIERVRRKESSVSLKRDGVFSNEMELILLWFAWISLALCTIPVAKEAFATNGFWESIWKGVWPLATLLIIGGPLILLWRKLDRPVSTWTEKFKKMFEKLVFLGILLGAGISISINQAALIPSFMGSIAMLFWGLSLILIITFTVYQFSIITSFPLLSLLFAGLYLLNLNRINDNHQVRLRPISLKDAEHLRNQKNRHLPSLEVAFTSWLLQREADILSQPKPYPIYVVSAQGGGIYAAYHSAKALAVLSDEVPGFSDHLFAISGVSGGSVGATVFANALRSEGHRLSDGSKVPLLSKRIEDYFANRTDRLAMIVSTMMFGDTAQRFFPLPVAAWDRSLGLELGFENLRPDVRQEPFPIQLDGSFYLTQDPTLSPEYTLPQSRRQAMSDVSLANRRAAPFLVLNTTEVKNGRRFILAPFQVPPEISRFHAGGRSGGNAKANSFDQPAPVRLTDADFHEPWVQKPERMEPQDIRFSTAAALSARFPIVSPYGFFPETQSRRLIDGGLYDNSGAVTAYEIIEALKNIQQKYASIAIDKPERAEHKSDKKERLGKLMSKIRIHPIAIVDDKAVNLDSSYAELDNLAGQRKKMQWLGWSAIDAVLSTREARIQKAVDLLSRFDGDGKDADRQAVPRRVLLRKEFRLAGEPRPTFSIPLGWKLSCQARAFINDQIQPLPRADGEIHPVVSPPWNADGASYSSLPCEQDGPLQRVPVRSQREDPFRATVGRPGAGADAISLTLPHQASLSRPFWWLILKLREDLGLATAQSSGPSKP